MNTVDTYWANVYIGLQESYTGPSHSILDVYRVCQDYCNEVKLGLTVTPTKFIYVDGQEDGAIIGLINYPRFPSEPKDIRMHAKNIARLCMKELKQERCSIMAPDITYMMGKE